MDIIDIIIAKKKSFTSETAKLVKDAQEAMAKANEVATIITDAQDALAAAAEAQEAAEAANARSTEVAAQFEEISNNLDEAVQEAASAVVDDKIAAATSEMSSSVAAAQTAAENAQSAATEAQNTAADAITDVDVISDDTATAKVKKTRVRKRGIQQAYDTMKNYTSTGSNEDGSMTQKAITQALQDQKIEITNNFETQIKNIQINGGGSGNVSGNITSEDAGSMVVINDSGNISASDITEEDLIRAQIALGTYQDKNILGIEADYVNKTVTRIQGAEGLTAGADFDSFTMYGGRKRCLVDNTGNIIQFIDNTASTLPAGNVMIYQPAFYYMRVPMTTTSDSLRGTQIRKEQIFISANKNSGFSIFPLFIDKNGKELKYVLLPAFESSAILSDGTHVINDAQNIELATSQLASRPGAKPISGQNQPFTIAMARRMAQNIGENWSITNLEAEAALQLLMIIEYASFNMQMTFNKGLTEITSVQNTNCAANTGSTLFLGNASGQAEQSVITINNNSTTYTGEGKVAISYRGMENPYGNIWRFIDNLTEQGIYYTLNNKRVEFANPGNSGWINNFGYERDIAWAFLPRDVSTAATSLLPVGDNTYNINNNELKTALIGGYATSNEYAGLFAYAFDALIDAHKHTYSARIMYKPLANSTVETNNYNKWLATM